MRFQSVDRPPYWPSYPWQETVKRWIGEGFREGTDLRAMFSAEAPIFVGIYYGPMPRFEEKVIEENDHTRVIMNHEGILMRELKERTETSMPQFMKFPVETLDDYRAMRWRLQPNLEDRFPPDWPQKIAAWDQRTDPLCCFGNRQAGFFGSHRNLMGLENFAIALHDDPALIEEMMEDRVDLIITVTERILQDIQFDYFGFWEDMAFKTGPLISPAMFRRIMVPRYRRVTDFLRSKGIDLIFVDSDGDINSLIPLWLEAGVNGVWPLEVQSNMDPVALRKEYGDDLRMIGGIDKKALARDKQAIRDEVMSKVPWLIERGGYLPQADHSIPPDVPWDNYRYFMELLGEVLGCQPGG
jgi:hypothetical protein